MEMPKPGAEQARLARFVGSWSGDETLAPSPWGAGGPARGRCVLRMDIDGMALVQDYVEEREGQVAFRGHGVFLVDPASGDVMWWFFDSMGFPPEPARGRWEGDVLKLEKKTPRGEARYEFRLGLDAYDFSIENRFPGQTEFVTFMKGRYQRER